MKKPSIKLATSTLLAIPLLTGCGGENITKQILSQQPHIKKITRELKDWTWNVDTIVKKDDTNGIYFTTHYYDNIPDKIKHFQFFIDSDDNTKTGFCGSDGWEVFGADYLIEDDILYKSLSNTKWTWEQVGKIAYKDNKKEGNERVITLQCPLSMAKEIQSDKVNVYIEPYDANWVGEYFTIPIPNIEINKNANTSTGNILGTLETDSVSQIAISDDNRFAYLADGKSGFKVVDISNPSKLSVISTLNTTGYLHQIVISSDGTKAYVSSTYKDEFLQIIDIADPKHPKSLSKFPIKNRYKFQLAEDKIYFSGKSLQVIDVSQAEHPKKIREIDFSIGKFILSKDTDIIYALTYKDIKIIDFKDKSDPKVLSTIPTKRSLENIAISNDGNTIFAVGSEGEKGGFIIDVSNPKKPTILDTIDTWDLSTDIALSSDETKAYITNNDLQIWDISNPKAKFLIDKVDIPSSANDIVISSDGTKAYISSGNIGYKYYFQVVDISTF